MIAMLNDGIEFKYRNYAQIEIVRKCSCVTSIWCFWNLFKQRYSQKFKHYFYNGSQNSFTLIPPKKQTI